VDVVFHSVFAFVLFFLPTEGKIFHSTPPMALLILANIPVPFVLFVFCILSFSDADCF
jgi:hypothetical protein